MNTNKLLLAFSSLAFVVASSGAFVACSSDDSSNAGPTPLDASTVMDANNTVDSGPGADANHPDTGTADSAPDVGSCMSDAATCNSCLTPAQDPLHACAPSSANCVAFDNTRVPANVPQPP